MNIIDINTSSPYPLIAGSGLLKETGGHIRRFIPEARAVAVITDDTVDRLYGNKVR